MIYNSAKDWRDAKQKRILLFGMSGLGKTHVSNMLRASGSWFHYSIDYRIGTRYMGEFIVDNFKKEAMNNPFLAKLLRTDSIYIGSNITFENLSPLSTYLGKPGKQTLGGLGINEYKNRQTQHERAEIAALNDTAMFIERAKNIYGYDHFVCDSGGSICEVIDPSDPDDPVLKELSENLLLVWIKGSPSHTSELVNRFDAAPKPMCYQRGFLETCWNDYLLKNNVKEDEVDPDDFVRSTYRRAMDHRQPRYEAMANRWGVEIDATDISKLGSPADFNKLIGQALEMR